MKRFTRFAKQWINGLHATWQYCLAICVYVFVMLFVHIVAHRISMERGWIFEQSPTILNFHYIGKTRKLFDKRKLSENIASTRQPGDNWTRGKKRTCYSKCENNCKWLTMQMFQVEIWAGRYTEQQQKIVGSRHGEKKWSRTWTHRNTHAKLPIPAIAYMNHMQRKVEWA